MSQPLIKPEMHDQVNDFVNEHGEPDTAYVLHDEIDHPSKRSWLYDEFIEWLSK